ncbi:unnamed protein product [Closterium sp. NIES-64]|nr:unnamed protein product [Closterium sp. NIES-64]
MNFNMEIQADTPPRGIRRDHIFLMHSLPSCSLTPLLLPTRTPSHRVPDDSPSTARAHSPLSRQSPPSHTLIPLNRPPSLPSVAHAHSLPSPTLTLTGSTLIPLPSPTLTARTSHTLTPSRRPRSPHSRRLHSFPSVSHAHSLPSPSLTPLPPPTLAPSRILRFRRIRVHLPMPHLPIPHRPIPHLPIPHLPIPPRTIPPPPILPLTIPPLPIPPLPIPPLPIPPLPIPPLPIPPLPIPPLPIPPLPFSASPHLLRLTPSPPPHLISSALPSPPRPPSSLPASSLSPRHFLPSLPSSFPPIITSFHPSSSFFPLTLFHPPPHPPCSPSSLHHFLHSSILSLNQLPPSALPHILHFLNFPLSTILPSSPHPFQFSCLSRPPHSLHVFLPSSMPFFLCHIRFSGWCVCTGGPLGI